MRLREQGGLWLKGGAVEHSGVVRKTDRAARRDVASVRLNGRSSLRPDLAGDLLRPFYWLLSSVVVATCVCEVFEARSNFSILG